MKLWKRKAVVFCGLVSAIVVKMLGSYVEDGSFGRHGIVWSRLNSNLLYLSSLGFPVTLFLLFFRVGTKPAMLFEEAE